MSDYDEGYRAGMQKVREVGQRRIEELSNCVAVLEAKLSESEALLAKAVEGLRFYAEGEWLENYPGGVLYAAGDDTPEFKTHLDYGDKARTTLAELKGDK